MAELLSEMGLTEEDVQKASASAVAKEFVPLASGVYPATIERVSIYEGKFGPTLHVSVKVKHEDEERTVKLRKDIGKTLKDKTVNGGFLGKIKQACFAAGVEFNGVQIEESDKKIKAFGSEYPTKDIVALAGKPVLALVRLSRNKNAGEDDKFRDTNDIEGLVALNGEDVDGVDSKTGMNAKARFEEKCAKKPIFTHDGYSKAVATGAGATAGAAGAGGSATNNGVTPPQF